MVNLVGGGRQLQLLVHVPVGQAHGAVQVEEPGFGSELQGHGGSWSLREELQLRPDYCQSKLKPSGCSQWSSQPIRRHLFLIWFLLSPPGRKFSF